MATKMVRNMQYQNILGQNEHKLFSVFFQLENLNTCGLFEEIRYTIFDLLGAKINE